MCVGAAAGTGKSREQAPITVLSDLRTERPGGWDEPGTGGTGS